MAKLCPPPPWQWMSSRPGRITVPGTPDDQGASAAARLATTPSSTVTTPSVSPAVGTAPRISIPQGCLVATAGPAPASPSMRLPTLGDHRREDRQRLHRGAAMIIGSSSRPGRRRRRAGTRHRIGRLGHLVRVRHPIRAVGHPAGLHDREPRRRGPGTRRTRAWVNIPAVHCALTAVLRERGGIHVRLQADDRQPDQGLPAEPVHVGARVLQPARLLADAPRLPARDGPQARDKHIARTYAPDSTTLITRRG